MAAGEHHVAGQRELNSGALRPTILCQGHNSTRAAGQVEPDARRLFNPRVFAGIRCPRDPDDVHAQRSLTHNYWPAAGARARRLEGAPEVEAQRHEDIRGAWLQPAIFRDVTPATHVHGGHQIRGSRATTFLPAPVLWLIHLDKDVSQRRQGLAQVGVQRPLANTRVGLDQTQGALRRLEGLQGQPYSWDITMWNWHHLSNLLPNAFANPADRAVREVLDEVMQIQKENPRNAALWKLQLPPQLLRPLRTRVAPCSIPAVLRIRVPDFQQLARLTCIPHLAHVQE
mmetsp:Transcript_44012/g.141110  ORF Transcript_44012/g.141110 Transcript_44012/m.141110 type:complete len:285 (+) Transcript_44012:390-1244(+)